MKKFGGLGRSLSMDEQKQVMGGNFPPGGGGSGCTATYLGCNNSPEYGGVTCDYRITCSTGTWDSCFTQCNSGDGGGCAS